MFTGLIQEVGKISSVIHSPSGSEISIEAPQLIGEIKIGDSISTNGVCLTATKIQGTTFSIHAAKVTLEKTNLRSLHAGDSVNLELSLKLSDRLGGHLVQGHINQAAPIKSIKQKDENFDITLEAPSQLRKYMIQEGSIALDGISLTIANITDHDFTVTIIPHTLHHTNLNNRKVGDLVNIEVDMMAKYVENFIQNAHSNDNNLFSKS